MTKAQLRQEAEDARRESLGVQDRLDDLLAGLEFWRETKCSLMELTVLDEMLIRWVEHNEDRA